jgi:S1-C subfamily serine protease
VLRGAGKLSFDVPVLQHHEQVQDLADIPDLQKSYVPKLSVFVTDLTQEVQKVLRPEQTFSGIAVVAEAASPFALDTGLKKGDIIRSINGAMLEQVDQLRTAIPSIKSGDPVVLQIERGGKLQYLAFESE